MSKLADMAIELDEKFCDVIVKRYIEQVGSSEGVTVQRDGATFRFKEVAKAYLRTLGKYYIVDIGLRNYLLGFRNRDSGHAIENVVYFELLRRGYDVAIGKIGNAEVDFIATTADEKKYIQVTESMMSEDVRKRELAPLQSIRDNYEKIVLSLEPGLDTSYDGIKSENLIDWLLSE